MRIIKVIHGYPPEYQAGSEVYSKYLCEALSAQGHEVIVFTRTENLYAPDYEVIPREKGEGVAFYTVNMAREKDGFEHPEVDRQFNQLIRDWKPDVIHVGHLNHLSTGLTGVARKEGIPVVFTLHDFWLLCPRGQFLQTNFGQANYYKLCSGQEHQKCARNCYNAYAAQPTCDASLNQWTHWVERRMQATQQVLQDVSLFLSPSEYLSQRFIQVHPDIAPRMRVLRYGFPLSHLRPTKRQNSLSPFTFGYIGTHIPAKGINLLVDAFLSLKTDCADIQLLIWGRDNGAGSRSLRLRATDPAIQFIGEYPNKHIAYEVFDRIDCLVVPSIWTENAPLVIQEAQQCRVPVITADVGGMAELVTHHVNGLLFKHRDAESLSQAMREACHNPEEMYKWGQKGFLHSHDGNVPSIKEQAAELTSIYQHLLQS